MLVCFTGSLGCGRPPPSPPSQLLTPVLGSRALVLTHLPGRQLLLGATWYRSPPRTLEWPWLGQWSSQKAGISVSQGTAHRPSLPLNQAHGRPRAGKRGEAPPARHQSKPFFVYSCLELLLRHVEAAVCGAGLWCLAHFSALAVLKLGGGNV
jgi:hypothetical protein